MKDGVGPTRVWSFRDVTREEQALQALRESDSAQKALMDAFPGYVAVVDADGIYTYANQRLAELLESSVDQIMGRHMRDVHDFMADGIRQAQVAGKLAADRDPDAEAWIFLGGILLLAIYFATAVCPTSMPSLRSSPCIRGAPQSGFATLISRIRRRMSPGVVGRPPRGRDFQRQ